MHGEVISKIVIQSGGDATTPQSPITFGVVLSPPLVLPPHTTMSVDKIRAEWISIFGDIYPNPTEGEEVRFLGIEGLGGAFCGMRIIAPPSATQGSNIANINHAGIIYMSNNDDALLSTQPPHYDAGLFSLNNNKQLIVSELKFQFYGHKGESLTYQDYSNFSNDNIVSIQLSFYKQHDPMDAIRDLVATLKSNNQLAIENNITDGEKIDIVNSNP
tara:strand:- start:4549 stop:5196 length:648 start_codon:yes stop_codon:yes gene_type:complete